MPHQGGSLANANTGYVNGINVVSDIFAVHTISATGQIVRENVVSDSWADRQSNSDRFEGEEDGNIDAEGTDPGSDRFNPVIRKKRRRNHSKQ